MKEFDSYSDGDLAALLAEKRRKYQEADDKVRALKDELDKNLWRRQRNAMEQAALKIEREIEWRARRR